tara:strand:+ start:345 stop:539 length:195 start_codon:yes stop_codon:yes gene_type:complete
MLIISSALTGCYQEKGQEATPALFNSRQAAEKAAKDFNCTGAHKMGTKWMPCDKHLNHQGHQHN